MYKVGCVNKKTTLFPLIASSSNGYSFYSLYFSTSSIFSGSTDFPGTYPTFKQRKPVLSRNYLTWVGLRLILVIFSMASLASAILVPGCFSKYSLKISLYWFNSLGCPLWCIFFSSSTPPDWSFLMLTIY